MLLPTERWFSWLMGELGFAALILSLCVDGFGFVGGAVALLCFLIGWSSATPANRFGRELEASIGRRLRVRTWDTHLRDGDCDEFELVSLLPLGAGLSLHLRVGDSQRVAWLKLAQPTTLEIDADHVRIGFAGYVSWDGQRLPGPTGQRSPGLIEIDFIAPVP